MVTMSVEDPAEDFPLLPEAVTPTAPSHSQPITKPQARDFFLSRYLCRRHVLNVDVWRRRSVTLVSPQEPEPGPRCCAAARMLLGGSDSCVFPPGNGGLPQR